MCACARCCESLGVWTVLAGWVLAAGLTAPGCTLCSKDRQGCWPLCGPHAETFERMASLITAGSASRKPRQRQITHIFTKCKLPSVLLPSSTAMACGLHFVFVCIQDCLSGLCRFLRPALLLNPSCRATLWPQSS